MEIYLNLVLYKTSEKSYMLLATLGLGHMILSDDVRSDLKIDACLNLFHVTINISR